MARNLRCNLTPERMEAVFGYFETEYDFFPDVAEESQMLGVFPQYLFYDTPFEDRNIRTCFCTSCGTFDMFRNADTKRFFEQSHNDPFDCPICGNGVTMKALGRMRTFSSINDNDERRFSIFRAAPDGGLMVISGWGRRNFSHWDLRGELSFRAKELQYFSPGERMRWKRCWEYDGLCNTGYAHPVGWEPCDYMAEPFSPSMCTSDGSYFAICSERIENTKLKYCRMEDWYHDRCKVWLSDTMEPVRFIHKFLSLYTAYPNLEMACRLGFWQAVDDLVDSNRKNAQLLDWSAKTSWGFLRLSKADGRAFLRCGGSMDDLALLASARKWDKDLNLTRFWDLLGDCQNDARLANLVVRASKLTGVSPQKVFHYLTNNTSVSWNRAQMLVDYLEFAKFLNYDLSRLDVALPKDLKTRHDAAANAAGIVKAERDAEISRKCASRVRQTKQMYEFVYGGYCILAPNSVQEIVNEGRTLHHCVGGYADRHFNGVLEILFLRKITEQDKPWITIEVAHRKQPTERVTIKQMYGEHNRLGLPHWKKVIGWFIDAWTAWLESGSPRDAKGNPIIPIVEEVSA